MSEDKLKSLLKTHFANSDEYNAIMSERVEVGKMCLTHTHGNCNTKINYGTKKCSVCQGRYEQRLRVKILVNENIGIMLKLRNLISK